MRAALQEIETTQTERRRYRQYPTYRDSGVPWLAHIPANWQMMRFKFLLASPLKYGANEPAELDDPSLPRYIRITDINDDGTLREDTFKSLPEATAQPYLLHDSDLLLARSGATVGKTFLYDSSWGRAAYAGYLIRARLRRSTALPRFVYYFTNSKPYWEWLDSTFIQATIQNVCAEKYANLSIPLPRITEQKQITSYLDRETARIDGLIAKKTHLIELLQEKRAALISHAVTKGLNPNVSMRDSGIPWLGQLPKHWQLKRIKFAAQIGNGSTPSRENPEYWDGWFPWLNSSVVNLAEVTEPTELVSDLALRECHLPRLTPPAVLVGITGEGKTRGMVTVLRIEATINQHLAFVRPRNHDCVVEYVRYVLHAAYEFLRDESDGGGSTKGAITCNRLGNTAIPFPPANEQAEIATHIDSVSAKLDNLIAKVTIAIGTLREYRSVLITAAVTGKIDLREEDSA